MNYQTFLAQNLDRIMKEKGYNPFSLMKAVNEAAKNPADKVGHTFVTDIIKGKSKEPSRRKLSNVSRILGCSLDELYGEKDKISKKTENLNKKRNTFRKVPKDEDFSSMNIEMDVVRLRRQIEDAIDGFDAALSKKNYLKSVLNQAPYSVLHAIFWGLISNALKYMPNVQNYLESTLEVDYSAVKGASCFSTTEEAV